MFECFTLTARDLVLSIPINSTALCDYVETKLREKKINETTTTKTEYQKHAKEIELKLLSNYSDQFILQRSRNVLIAANTLSQLSRTHTCRIS